jgi:hypothetical protein
MYENGKMRSVETILKMGVEGIEENGGGVNLTKIYCKHFCKCHNMPPAQQYDNKNNNEWAKNFDGYPLKENKQMANNYVKKCSTSLFIRDI